MPRQTLLLLLAATMPPVAALAQSSTAQPARPLATAAPAFVANHGQWAGPAGYRIAGRGATAWLCADAIGLDLRGALPAPASGAPDGARAVDPTVDAHAALRLRFVGADPRPPRAAQPRPGRAHFYLGDDPRAWRTDVPTFGEVHWQRAWRGIDVVARTHAAGLLEFTLEVAAGVDPSTAVFRWEGADRLDAEADGALRLSTPAGTLAQSAPIAWQRTPAGERLPLAVALEQLPDHAFRFRVTGARPDLPVAIDPVLTFLGGLADESATGIVPAPNGHAVVAGSSNSAPTAGGRDVVVTCLDLTAPPLATVVWTATLGGSLDERAFDVATDAAGFVTVVGGTLSTDFPTTPGALQPTQAGGLLDGFVVQLTANGQLQPGGFATYHGGSGADWCIRVVVDALLQPTIAGLSDSGTLPGIGVGSRAPTNAGARDAFVVRLAPFGTGYTYGTFLGGSGDEGVPAASSPGTISLDARELGLDVDAAGRVLIAARTFSANFPTTPGCYQPVRAGGADAFATILDPALPPASQLVYSTHLGDTLNDGACAARFGRGADIVLGGYTYSTGFRSTPNAYRPAFVGPALANDAFVSVLDLNLSGAGQLVYSTFLGGQSSTGTLHFDACQALVVDRCGRITAIGFCCGDAPWPAQLAPVQPVHGGNRDGFAVRIDPRLAGPASLVAATFLGGAGQDVLMGVAAEPQGGALVCGHSSSPAVALVPLPTAGGFDAIAGRLEMLPQNVVRGGCTSGYCAGAAVTDTLTLAVDRQPAAGAAFALQVDGAPPMSIVLLGLGLGPAAPPVPFLGAIVCAGPAPLLLAEISDACGAWSFSLSVPPGWPTPIGVHAQAFAFTPPTCALPFTSSATLQL